MRTVSVTPQTASVIKYALTLGYYQHDVAAYFGLNQGRVSEINTGKRWRGVKPATSLPSGFPRMI
jgi:hypothetical protein